MNLLRIRAALLVCAGLLVGWTNRDGKTSTEFYIIEEESSGLPGLEGIERSLKRLHGLGR